MKLFPQCQSDLENTGIAMMKLELPIEVKTLLLRGDLQKVDEYFKDYLTSAPIRELFSSCVSYQNLEFIIARRFAEDPEEEDGIWHDDGSRIFAFSLSLTLGKIEGGVLGFKKINSEEVQLIPTQPYGTLILFKTGTSGYEHKIHKVTSGERIVCAGWLT